jgi:hypothetical protein
LTDEGLTYRRRLNFVLLFPAKELSKRAVFDTLAAYVRSGSSAAAHGRACAEAGDVTDRLDIELDDRGAYLREDGLRS